MSKLISLSEAVQQYVHDGDLVYAAGFTHLIPFAAGHEIIRQKRRNLRLARATPDLIYDQLVAAGCARQVIFSYMGNPGVGSLRIVRAEMDRPMPARAVRRGRAARARRRGPRGRRPPRGPPCSSRSPSSGGTTGAAPSGGARRPGSRGGAILQDEPGRVR